jgi:ubiquinone/menaquinone biosynthesis C-methylase UbiE
MSHIEGYFDTRLAFDKKRLVLWNTLCTHFFQKLIPHNASVVELGAGWCDFINTIDAQTKTAVDIWDGIERHANKDVRTIVGSATELDGIPFNSVDMVFTSNLFEHLTQDQIAEILKQTSRILQKNGRLVLVQPNFRTSYKRYFDDYTHTTIWTDKGMATFLEANGFKVEQVQAKFLPLTVKSKLPTSSLLIRLYLRSPIKPLAGQMLIVAKPNDS